MVVWADTVEDEWVEVVASSLSVPETGSVAPTAVATTTLLRMSAACAVVPAVPVQLLSLTLAIHLLWKLLQAMAWALDPWLALPDRDPSPPLLVDLALVVDMVNISVVLQALMRCPPASA